MTQQEYKEAKDVIEKEAQEKIKALSRAYAIANNPYKVGDIITNGFTTIRIKSYSVYMSYTGFPEMLYKGDSLTKKLENKKKDPSSEILQNRVTSLIPPTRIN